MKRKLNLIILTDFISRALEMHGIKIIVKFDDIIYQKEPDKA